MRLPPRERLARIVALAVIIAIGIYNVYFAVSHWTLSDADAYWQAGLRLRAGEPLYPPLSSAEGSEIYRYAPWFAWLAVPWTYLSESVAAVLWSAVLLGASALALWPLIRLRAWILVAFFAPDPGGHQRGRQRPAADRGGAGPGRGTAQRTAVDRAGGFPEDLPHPAGAGVRRAAPVVGVRGHGGDHRAAWLPAVFLYDLSAYPVSAGQAGALIGFPIIYFAVVGIAMGATFALAPDPLGVAGGRHGGGRLTAAPLRLRRDLPDGRRGTSGNRTNWVHRGRGGGQRGRRQAKAKTVAG